MAAGKTNGTSAASAAAPPALLRKSVMLPIGGTEIRIPVDWQVLEVVERVWDMAADMVPLVLADPRKVKRSKIAECILEWMDLHDGYSQCGLSREAAREAIITADFQTVINRLVGAIQGAVLYMIKRISAEEFETLSRGEGLGDDPAHPQTDDDETPADDPSSATAT
jgi:hypothetical protein